MFRRIGLFRLFSLSPTRSTGQRPVNCGFVENWLPPGIGELDIDGADLPEPNDRQRSPPRGSPATVALLRQG